MNFKRGGWVVAAVLAGAALLACGPDFPNMLLIHGDGAVLAAPSARFDREIQRLLPESPFHYSAPPEGRDESVHAELQDLRLSLESGGMAGARIEEILTKHLTQRNKLQAGTEDAVPPEGIPQEFAYYFRGCAYWQRAEAGSDDEARWADYRKAAEAWSKILRLPASERWFKSTWAAYMIGVVQRRLPEGGAEAALESFQQVRAYAAEGFADSLGLAAASLGLSGQIEYKRGHYAAALEFYLEQAATGDPTATESLRIVASEALKLENAETMEELASKDIPRRIMTLYLVSRGSPYASVENEGLVTRWLEHLEKQSVIDLELAEQLALAAYQQGEMDLAKRWLSRGNGQSFAVRWLKAKLLFYDGEMDQAAGILSNLVAEFPWEAAVEGAETREDLLMEGTSPVSARAQVAGELGTIRLARREFVEALDALLRSGYWLDAAYVAERVLTLEELTGYVEKQAPDEVIDLRYLLARRLARSGQGEKARAYFPEPWRSAFEEFLAMRASGQDPANGPRERAKELFTAARIMREKGLELFGTETAPDWRFYEGSFTEGVTVEGRGQLGTPDILIPSKEEMTRAHRHAPEPDTRFHYRYTAAELAMEAARLLPDNELETAIILCTAGSWIKYLDPKAADVYYKSLVRRCRKTEIGREADRIRWFPRIDETGKILPKEAPPLEAPVPPEEDPPLPAFAVVAQG